MKQNRYKKDQLEANQYTVSKEILDQIEIIGCKTPKEKLVYVTLEDTLMRREELATLKIEKINEKEGIVAIKGKGGKERVIPITKRSIELIKSFVGNRTKGYVLRRYARDGTKGYKEKPIMIWAINKIIMRIGKRAGFVNMQPGRKHLHPHFLRHSMARYLLDKHVPVHIVQQILGHDSVDTTIRIYGKPPLSSIVRSYQEVMEPRPKPIINLDPQIIAQVAYIMDNKSEFQNIIKY